MFHLKWPGKSKRSLLQEIEERKQEISKLRKEINAHYEEYMEVCSKYTDLTKKYKKELSEATEAMGALEKENAIMREYYHLDQEPTDEQQTKIRINLRCYDLERENSKIFNELTAMRLASSMPQYIYKPYYPLCYRSW